MNNPIHFRNGWVLVLLLLGCSGKDKWAQDRPTPVPASGIVTYKGSPVADALVVFSPEQTGNTAPGESAKLYAGTAQTDSDGRFRLMTFESNDGAVPGKYTVLITKLDKSTFATPPLAGASQNQAAADGTEAPDSEARTAGGFPGGAAGPAPGSRADRKPRSEIPEKYGIFKESPLKAQIDATGPNEFNFDLTD